MKQLFLFESRRIEEKSSSTAFAFYHISYFPVGSTVTYIYFIYLPLNFRLSNNNMRSLDFSE